MAMTGAMSAGIAGLKAHMDALNVVGNNVANVNTYGYKAGRVTFRESIYATQSVGSAGTDTVGGTNPRQIGYGCSVGTIDLNMSTQSLESTGMALDAAIQGDGFFLVGPKNLNINSADAMKSLTFSRVGDFRFDADGYLVDGGGNVVYGFLMTCDADPANPTATTPGTTEGNFSTDLVPIRLPMAAAGGAGGTGGTTITEGDTLYPYVDGTGNNQNATTTTTPASTGKPIKYDSLQIDENGKITCVNANTKQPVVVGCIALGSVTNPNGLVHSEGPYYTVGEAAGDMSVFTPNSAVKGSLKNGKIQAPGGGATPDPATTLLAGSSTSLLTGFLEASGTDLATEFANMIIYQRGYQANTRIVTVTDTMLEELVNMKR